jgi:hypothetical protein
VAETKRARYVRDPCAKPWQTPVKGGQRRIGKSAGRRSVSVDSGRSPKPGRTVDSFQYHSDTGGCGLAEAVPVCRQCPADERRSGSTV